jgi:CheY-like chemotaxis protein
MPRILVAEDDPGLLELWGEVLKQALVGIEVLTATDGVHAIASVRAFGPFNLFLFDDEMPRLTGRQALAQLRHEGEYAPALLLSGTAHLTEQEALTLGVKPLSKPISVERLVVEVLQAMLPAAPKEE